MKSYILLLLLIPFIVQAQQPKDRRDQIDSLEKVLSVTDKDTSILKAWDEMATILSNEKSALTEKYLLKIDSLCTSRINQEPSADSLKKYLEFKSRALDKLGRYFYENANYDQSIRYWKKAIFIYEELKEHENVATVYNGIGLSYIIRGNYAKAMANYVKGLKVCENNDNDQGAGLALNYIGNLYEDQKNYSKAIASFKKALPIFEKIDFKPGIAGTLSNIGNNYENLDNLEKALDYLEQSLAIQKEINNQLGIGAAYSNIGKILVKKGDYPRAQRYLSEALNIFKEHKYQKGIAVTLGNISLAMHSSGNYIESIEYGNRALAVSKEIGSVRMIRDASETLWRSNKKLGNSKKALEMYELYITTRDSIDSEENQKEVIRQEYKYEYEKQSAADSIANAKANEIRDAQIAQQEAEIKAKRNQQYGLFGGLFLVIVLAVFMYNRFRVTQKQKGIIEDKEKETSLQKRVIEEKHKEITDSIQYAKRIQNAILPPQKLVKELLPQSFVFYKPKDVVAGDFYWMEPIENGVLFSVADCTGHGVPGAMVSVVCNNGLNRAIREFGLTTPSKILDKTRDIVIQEFEKSEENVKDGMDIALCALYQHTNTNSILHYAGAHNPLWIIRKNSREVEEIKADKQPIGKFGAEQPFTNHTQEMYKGDTLYIFSDGFPDQFGGEKGKKYKSGNFKKLLLSIVHEPMGKQRAIIEKTFEDWKGELEQLDDVCVIGVRI